MEAGRWDARGVFQEALMGWAAEERLLQLRGGYMQQCP